MHRPPARTLPLAKSADVLVARGGVGHAALAVHRVCDPLAFVHVAVRVRHGAEARSVRGHDVARVRVAVHVRRDARPVGAAAGERAGEVVAGEVGLFHVAGDAGGVVGAEAEVL